MCAHPINSVTHAVFPSQSCHPLGFWLGGKGWLLRFPEKCSLIHTFTQSVSKRCLTLTWSSPWQVSVGTDSFKAFSFVCLFVNSDLTQKGPFSSFSFYFFSSYHFPAFYFAIMSCFQWDCKCRVRDLLGLNTGVWIWSDYLNIWLQIFHMKFFRTDCCQLSVIHTVSQLGWCPTRWAGFGVRS